RKNHVPAVCAHLRTTDGGREGCHLSLCAIVKSVKVVFGIALVGGEPEFPVAVNGRPQVLAFPLGQPFIVTCTLVVVLDVRVILSPVSFPVGKHVTFPRRCKIPLLSVASRDFNHMMSLIKVVIREEARRDRKSTRLNSSHVKSSYA